MATTTINTHLGKNIEWTVYRNGHNEFQCALTLNSVAYDISALPFTVYFRTPSGSQDKLTLIEEAGGLVNGGATGLLTIPLTEAKILASLPRDMYFMVIEYTTASKTYPLAQGYVKISDETNPGTTTTTTTIPVNIAGVTVSMAITLAGVTSAAIASALGYTPDNVKGVTASGTDTYTATYTPAPTAYVTGQRFTVIFTNANTGAATLNLNSLGAKSIKKNTSEALASGDITAGEAVDLVYDGTNLQIVGGGGSGGGWAVTGTTELTGPVTISPNGNSLIIGTAATDEVMTEMYGGIFSRGANGIDIETSGDANYTASNGVTSSALQLHPDGNAEFDIDGLLQFGGLVRFNLGSDAIGDIFQRNASGNFSRLAAVATGNVLRSAGVGTVNTWGKVTSAHVDSSIVPSARTIAGVDLADNVTAVELNDALKTRRVLYKNNVSASVTGTTNETLIDSFLIPAGTLGANDILYIIPMYTKSGGAGNWTPRMRVHTSSAVAGTVISTYTPASNVLYVKTKREMMFKNSLSSQVIFNTTASGNPSDDAGVASAHTDLTLDFTVDQYLIATIQLGSGSDTGTLQGWYVEIIGG